MIDCIILSYARDKQLERMTQRAVNSLIADGGTVYVVETGNATYSGCQTIHPNTEFNYNKFMKIGINSGSNPYVFMLNNDILCKKMCLKSLVMALEEFDSVSPKNPLLPQHNQFKEHYNEGFSIWMPGHFAGWAVMMKRETIKEIGINKLLPDDFKFWYQDNVMTQVLKNNGKRHALVTSAELEHFESKTLHGQQDKDHLTHEQKEIFDNYLESFE